MPSTVDTAAAISPREAIASMASHSSWTPTSSSALSHGAEEDVHHARQGGRGPQQPRVLAEALGLGLPIGLAEQLGGHQQIEQL